MQSSVAVGVALRWVVPILGAAWQAGGKACAAQPAIEPPSATSLPAAGAARPSDKTASPSAGKGAAEKPAVTLKYTVPTPEQVRSNHKTASAWAEQVQRTITPSLHLVETSYFLIYSAWDGGNDRALTEICERMYAEMCRQFDIPPGYNIWAGKCPVYVFREVEHYKKFTTKVDKVDCVKAGGYCRVRTDTGFVHIVMNRCPSRVRFYELLVHEATHGFLARYKTNRPLSQWVNEGLAEYMASKLVPEAGTAQRHVAAAEEAVVKNKDVSHIFRGMNLDAFDYGLAQSLVRYLIARDHKAFIKFINLMKEGKNEADALKESHGLTHDDLVSAWRQAAGRELKRR